MSKIPQHIAVIMDGNGRWAEQRQLPRIAGHRAGVEAVRGIVTASAQRGVKVLTLFAFSSENWQRPEREVGLLMDLFLSALEQEAKKLYDNDVCLRFIGDRQRFPEKLQNCIAEAEILTAGNRGLKLVIAANYGGRWDVLQALRGICAQIAAGEMNADSVTVDDVQAQMCLSDLPEPDLFIRSGGEQRISNYLLWQLAYTELYFTECLWPDFDDKALDTALASFAARQRRFGRTTQQLNLEADTV